MSKKAKGGGFFDSIFGGPKKTPEELFKEWRRDLRKEMRETQKQIKHIEREEKKVQMQIKKLAKQYNVDNTFNNHHPITAARGRQFAAAYGKGTGTIQEGQESIPCDECELELLLNDSEPAKSMVKLPELNATVQRMAMEMHKSGLIEEMIDDTMEEMEPDDLEELADEEVKNVVEELLGSKFIGASVDGLTGVPAAKKTDAAPALPAASAAETDLEKRLRAL